MAYINFGKTTLIAGAVYFLIYAGTAVFIINFLIKLLSRPVKLDGLVVNKEMGVKTVSNMRGSVSSVMVHTLTIEFDDKRKLYYVKPELFEEIEANERYVFTIKANKIRAFESYYNEELGGLHG